MRLFLLGDVMFKHSRLTQVEDYAPFIGAESVNRILEKAKGLQGLHVAHVNSTYYGGGVATLLDSFYLKSFLSSPY
jgi:trehalose synthase